ATPTSRSRSCGRLIAASAGRTAGSRRCARPPTRRRTRAPSAQAAALSGPRSSCRDCPLLGADRLAVEEAEELPLELGERLGGEHLDLARAGDRNLERGPDVAGADRDH